VPGTNNMLIGALWAIGGLLVTGATYSAASSGGAHVVAYGALAVGGIQFIAGLFQYIGYQVKGPEEKQQVRAEASVRVILRAMLATAAADGVVDDSEVERIATIYEQIFGEILEKEWVKETSEMMLQDNFDVCEAISDERDIINKEIIPLVLKASYFVAAADGLIDDKESKTLLNIASALGMNDEAVSDCLDDIHEAASV